MANRSWARTPLPAWTPCLLPLLLTDQQGLVVLSRINRVRRIEDQMDGVGGSKDAAMFGWTGLVCSMMVEGGGDYANGDVPQ